MRLSGCVKRAIVEILFIQTVARVCAQFNEPSGNELAGDNADRFPKAAPQNVEPPQVLPSNSYLSLDGLTLVVVFDKPVNLSLSVELAERRRAHIEWLSEPSGRAQHSLSEANEITVESHLNESHLSLLNNKPQTAPLQDDLCQLEEANEGAVQQPVRGVQLCARLLSKKTLKLLHKYKLYDCLWSSRVQFQVELGKPVASNQLPIKLTFQRHSIGSSDQTALVAAANEREFSVELNKLPLETLGLPLAPRLALTGPNQVPPCGQFTLSAHLSSPYGTQLGDQVRLSWSVEQIGFAASPPNSSSSSNSGQNASSTAGSSLFAASSQSPAVAELKWRALQQLVAANKANNLVLDAQLLNQVPQVYQFQVTASYTTASLQSAIVSLNASHQVGRIDYETPIGAIYGTHLLAQQNQLNANQEILLLADVSIPDCASSVKQVGLYWQVSDPRVRFEQTYAPYYLARANTLPEQSKVEFRLNLFYGIRVKKYSSAGALITMGDSVLDAHISDGTLVVCAGQNSESRSLELFASSEPEASDKFTYQWSCFDGKTAQTCSKKASAAALPAHNTSSIRYEIGANSQPASLFGQPATAAQRALAPLVDRARQRQSALRIPIAWLEPDAQLWFGLQRFDKQNPSQQSQTEYALVSAQPDQAASVSVGPVLIGRARQRATIRNPLTGAVVLVAGAQASIVGRVKPSSLVRSLTWSSPNYLHPLHWIVKNSTNPFNGERELLTELQLNKDFQLAHGQHKFHLTACTQTGTITAILQLDIVASVSQCRVNVQLAAVTSGLFVSVDYCNIPLGLSPITYQLYLTDSAASDQLLQLQADSQSAPAASSNPPDDDYVNETDEALLELRAEPLTMPQLSPVFSLSAFSGPGLMAMLNPPVAGANRNSTEPDGNRWPAQRARIRFGARVCDRLQSCRMFYSAPVNLKHLMLAASGSGQSHLALAGNSSTLSAAQLQQLDQLANGSRTAPAEASWAPTTLVPAVQSMIDTSKRASLAGNSIAAMALLNGAIKLSQSALSQAHQQTKLPLAYNQQRQQDSERANLRDLLQVAMRDCLHYGAQSMQRQLHYSDSGQTSLVAHILSRILRAPQSSVEIKFKTMRLMAQLMRRSINEQLSLKTNCLADMKALQAGYSALFGTFSHYSIDSNDKQQEQLAGSIHSNHANHNGINAGGQQLQSNASTVMRFSTLVNSALSSVVPNNSTETPSATLSQQTTPANRKKREEAILAYLRSVRHSYRGLLAAAAIQLPLGANQQLQYTSLKGSGDTDALQVARQPLLSAPTSSAETTTPAETEIVSSLSHLTELIATASIQIDLHEYGSATIQLDRKFLTKLNSQTAAGSLRCRNDTATKCSSFVLSITSFAGKAPFRALDLGQRLRVPLIELLFLSPVDGSNIHDLMLENGNSFDQSADSYKTMITFVVPRRLGDDISNTTSETSSRRRYKCYRFDEDSNEWLRSQEPPVEEADSDSELGNLVRIKCTFVGGQPLSVFGAFQGKPPQAEAVVRSPVVLGLLVLMGLVFLFSFVGCFASSSHSKRSSDGDKSDQDEDLADVQRNPARHPEQSYRNDFNYPPL